MRRRLLLALPLLASPLLASSLLVPPARAAGAAAMPELRVGGSAEAASRLARRLGAPVGHVSAGLVEALNRGHLELALLLPSELDRARARMGARLAVLPGSFAGRVLASRSVLPAPLREALAAALA